MKKLQLALLALIAGGVFATSADARFCGTARAKPAYARPACEKPCKRKCVRKCARPCNEDCVTTCVDRVESREGTKCVKVEVPVTYTRVCKDYTTTCTKKSSRCDNGCWEEQPCKVQVLCNGQPHKTLDANGNDLDE